MNKILSLLMLTLSLQIFAAESRGELQPTMKAMGAQFKVLNLALIRDQQTAAATVKAAADTLVLLLADAAKAAPEQLRDTNGNIKTGQEAELAVYDQLITRLTDEAKALQLALKNGDRALAAQILRERITPIMRDGHERFK